MGAYPEFVLTTRILGISPEMVGPDLFTLLETRTPIKEGNEAGGLPLFPGRAIHVPPHDGGEVLVFVANPLKLSGAAPPLSELSVDQLAPQNVTVAPVALSWSPMTKNLREEKLKMRVVAFAEEGR